MAKFDEMTVEINAKFHVDRRMADACLKLLEIYMNDNSDLRIAVTRLEDGTEHYYFIGRAEDVGTQQTNTETAGA